MEDGGRAAHAFIHVKRETAAVRRITTSPKLQLIDSVMAIVSNLTSTRWAIKFLLSTLSKCGKQAESEKKRTMEKRWSINSETNSNQSNILYLMIVLSVVPPSPRHEGCYSPVFKTTADPFPRGQREILRSLVII